MKLILEAIQQLELHAAHVEISESIALFETVEQLNRHNIARLRRKLQALFSDPNNAILIEDVPLSVADVTWHGLIVLAELLPLNSHENGQYKCPLSDAFISDTDVITVSTGYRYDIRVLSSFLSSLSVWFDPMTGLRFSSHDRAHIFQKTTERDGRFDPRSYSNISRASLQYSERLALYHQLICKRKIPYQSAEKIASWSPEHKKAVSQMSELQCHLWTSPTHANIFYSYINTNLIQALQLEKNSDQWLFQARAWQAIVRTTPQSLLNSWQMASKAANVADQQRLKILIWVFVYHSIGAMVCMTAAVSMCIVKTCYEHKSRCITDTSYLSFLLKMILVTPIISFACVLFFDSAYLLRVLLHQSQPQQDLFEHALQTQPNDVQYRINRTRLPGFFQNYTYTVDDIDTADLEENLPLCDEPSIVLATA